MTIKMTNKQTILISGATGSIGGGAAVALAKRGAQVVLLGRKLERLEARADSIRVDLSEAQIDYQDADIATLVIDFSDRRCNCNRRPEWFRKVEHNRCFTVGSR